VVEEARKLESVAVLEQPLVVPSAPAVHRVVWRFVRRKPLGALGFFLIALLVFSALTAPFIQRYGKEDTFDKPNPNYVEGSFLGETASPTVLDQRSAPTWKHWLGTDDFGRDTYSRIVWGSRRALRIGILALAIGTVIGVSIAFLSAYFGGLSDILIQRFMDAFQAFPPVLFLLLLATTIEPSLWMMTIGLAIVSVPSVSRIVRSVVLQAREMPYIEAARVVGASDLRIMLLHILPNVLAPIIIVFTIGIGAVILAEASLAFLGIGPPGVSWGEMLDKGRLHVLESSWQAVFAGTAITLAVLGFNLAGDALRDIWDPRLRT